MTNTVEQSIESCNPKDVDPSSCMTYCPEINANVLHFSSIDSTQTYVMRHIDSLVENYSHPVVVSADAQSSGKGTFDTSTGKHRTWFTGRENVAFTILVRIPANRVDLLHHLSQAAACAMVLCLENIGLHPRIKWINDVYVDGKKIGGVLTQIHDCVKGGDVAALIGVGMSRRSPVSSGHCERSDLDMNVTGIEEEVTHSSGKPLTNWNIPPSSELRVVILKHLLRFLNDHFINKSDPMFIIQLVNDKLLWKGLEVILERKVKEDEVGGEVCEEVFGKLMGVGPGGQVIIKSDLGEVSEFTSGRLRQRDQT